MERIRTSLIVGGSKVINAFNGAGECCDDEELAWLVAVDTNLEIIGTVDMTRLIVSAKLGADITNRS